MRKMPLACLVFPFAAAISLAACTIVIDRGDDDPRPPHGNPGPDDGGWGPDAGFPWEPDAGSWEPDAARPDDPGRDGGADGDGGYPQDDDAGADGDAGVPGC
jgi:hypothetical protein